jgi:hypothetical protein
MTRKTLPHGKWAMFPIGGILHWQHKPFSIIYRKSHGSNTTYFLF